MRTSAASGDLSDSSSSALMAVRNAARVLPEPVGAAISVCRPSAIDSQPRNCADVGSPTSVVNHRRTRGWKPSKAMGHGDPEERTLIIGENDARWRRWGLTLVGTTFVPMGSNPTSLVPQRADGID